MSSPSRVESIFFAALEKKTPEERSVYLDQACGSDSGRHSIQACAGGWDTGLNRAW